MIKDFLGTVLSACIFALVLMTVLLGISWTLFKMFAFMVYVVPIMFVLFVLYLFVMFCVWLFHGARK